jgi:hypothetical protein
VYWDPLEIVAAHWRLSAYCHCASQLSCSSSFWVATFAADGGNKLCCSAVSFRAKDLHNYRTFKKSLLMLVVR